MGEVVKLPPLVKIDTRDQALTHADAWERYAEEMTMLRDLAVMRADLSERMVHLYSAEVERLRELLK